MFKKSVLCMTMSLLIALSPAASVVFPEAVSVEAHSGRTDAAGGHHDNKNKSGLGSYHYHCGGYPAHLHTGGVCPYASSKAGSAAGTATVPAAPAVPAPVQAPAVDSGKYTSAAAEYDRRLSGGLFDQTILAQAMAVPNLVSYLSPQEQEDYFSSGVQKIVSDLTKAAVVRAYDSLAEQAAAQIQQQAGVQGAAQQAALAQMVAQVQTGLTQFGFYAGPVNGVFDAATQMSLVRFQTAYGLTADGTINAQILQLFGIAF